MKIFSVLLFASVPIVPACDTFACTTTAVWDGDGPVCSAEGSRVRLAGIATREADGTYNANQPYPDATAEQARKGLVTLIGTPGAFSTHGNRLVSGPTMRCRPPTRTTYSNLGRGETHGWMNGGW